MASYQEQTSGLPEWYNQGYHQMQNLGMTGLAQPFQGYSGQLVAGLMPYQNQAGQMAQNLPGSYQPYMQQASGLISGSAQASPTLGANYNAMTGAGQSQFTGAQGAIQGAMGANLAGAGAPQYGQAQSLYTSGSQFDPNKLAQHFNPYVSNVVQELGRLGGEQFTNVINPALTSSFQGLGQQGSSRQAALLADAAAKSQREILGQQGNALNTGYGMAQQDYLNWAQQGSNAAAGLAGLGQQNYNQLLGQANLGLQGAGQLAGIGGQMIGRQQGASQLQEQGWQNQLGNQLSAGTSMGNLGQAVQQSGLADIGALTAAGKSQQENAQQYLDKQYNEFLRQQQYPFLQAEAFGKMFPAAPTSSTNWSASFKKGGLARYADGGRFPDPMSILDRMRADGLTDEEIARDFDTGGETYRSRLVPAIRRPQDILRAEEDSMIAPSAQSNLMQRAFDERVKLLERVRNAEYLQPMDEGSTIGNIGEALLRASAEGPAHWGQLLGRAGASYFGKQDAVRNENKSRELARLALEEKITPDVGRAGGLGSGAMPGYVSVIGQDGKRYMVNRLNPNDRIEIGTGVNQGSLHDAADRYAREQIKDSIFKDDAEREARYNYHKQQYIGSRTGDGSMFPAAPGSTLKPGRAYDQSSYGAPEPEMPVDKAGKVILSPSEEEQQKKIGASEGARYDEMQKVGAASRGQLNTLNYLESNLDDITTGKLTPIKTDVKAWAKAFNIDLGSEDVPPAQAVQMISGQLALTLRNTSEGNGMPGSLSDNDLKFLKAMTPNLGNDPESNKRIINYSRKISQRNAEVAQKARDYIQNNPRGVLDAGFYRDLEKWTKANPLFESEQKSSQKEFDEMPDASLYDGKRLKSDDGTIYRSVNGQWVKEGGK